MTNLQRADQVLVPWVKIPIATRDVEVPIIDSVPIGDYSTIHISVTPSLVSTVAGTESRSAVMIIVRFTELIAYSGGSFGSVIGGGRCLCVGAIDIGAGGGVVPSNLDIRLPVQAQHVTISYACNTNQTNINGFFFAAMASTEPTYTYAKLQNPGYYFDNLTLACADSILGSNYSRNGLVLNAFGDFKFIEFAQQTLGKLSIHVETSTNSGAAFVTGDVVLGVVNKAWDDTAGVVDQMVWFLPQTNHSQVTGIPLTGFRQALFVQNTVSGVSRPITVKMTAFPEFP